MVFISFPDVSGCFLTLVRKGFAEYHEADSLQDIIGGAGWRGKDRLIFA
jgi:hypothetical protein